jgi:hypothetical protein
MNADQQSLRFVQAQLSSTPGALRLPPPEYAELQSKSPGWQDTDALTCLITRCAPVMR